MARTKRTVITPPQTTPPVELKLAADNKEPQRGVFVKENVLATVRASHRARRGEKKKTAEQLNPFKAPLHPPGVVPDGEDKSLGIAQDSQIDANFAWGMAAGVTFSEGLLFMGYAELSVLAQRPEFRVISQTIAEEMTREWIEFEASGGEDKADRIKELEDAIKEFGLKEACETAALYDGLMGRSHIFIDTCDIDDRDELKTSIGNGKDLISLAKFSVETKKRGEIKLKAFRNVEAIWCYPTRYDSIDPLKPEWYKPENWFVMGKEVHFTRLLTFIGRPVPDILKPAYSFGGLSLTQVAEPYVNNFLRTRQSISDLIHSFVVQGLKTNLASLMNAGGSALINRMEAFNVFRDNHDSFLLDKDTEDWFNVSTPLSGLDTLQAQSQEQIASVARIPLVKLLGIAPHGLNASSEGEIRVFYDTIKSYQEKFFRTHLTTCIHFIMLHLWGEVDKNITFKFKALWQLDEVAAANAEQVRTGIDEANVAIGAVSAEEVRERLAKDKESQYNNIDLSGPPPEPPMPPGMGGEPGPEGGDPFGGGDPMGGGQEPDLKEFKRAPDPMGGGHEPRGGVMDNGPPEFSKQEVGFEHPAQGEHNCAECEHFLDASDSCQLVSGLIRPEDWCELWEEEDGVGHWMLLVPTDNDDGDFDFDTAFLAQDDIDWKEEQHPRDKSGKFTSGAGTGGGKSKPQFPASSHKTKVKNSLAKTLAAHNYTKKKSTTASGHHIFEHPSGHQVFVGPSKENQEFVAGYRLAGTHKFGSGAGSLAKHLTEFHSGKGEAQPPKPQPLPQPKKEELHPQAQKSPNATPHPASKIQSVMNYYGGEPFNNSSSHHIYKMPGEVPTFVFIGKNKVPGTQVYPWTFTDNSGTAVSGKGSAELETQLYKWKQNQPKPGVEKKAESKVDSVRNQIKNNGDFEHYDSTEGTESWSDGLGGMIHFDKTTGDWSAEKNGDYITSGGPDEINAAFEALHPRGAGGKFIKKPVFMEPENDVELGYELEEELDNQGFSKVGSDFDGNIITYGKGDINVMVDFSNGEWAVTKNGKELNSGSGNGGGYSKIFETTESVSESELEEKPASGFITKPDPNVDLSFVANVKNELEKQGFKSSVFGNTMSKGGYEVFFGAGGNWQIKDPNGYIVDSGLYNYKDIFHPSTYYIEGGQKAEEPLFEDPGKDLKVMHQVEHALVDQGFKHSANNGGAIIYSKNGIDVSLNPAAGVWTVKKNGEFINSGSSLEFNKIFTTGQKEDTSAKPKEPPNQEVIPPAQPNQAVLDQLSFGSMTQTGPKLGSNPGGKYKDANGKEYYIKMPQTSSHTKNELLAAALFGAAGGNTLKYHPIDDNGKPYVGTEWQPLDKNNLNQLSPAEKKQAQQDFALHAWLANWDATGLTGDNLGVVNGKVVPLDFGGSLLYRAQGGAKGHLFNKDAGEWETLRDQHKNPMAYSLYGSMTPEELKQSAQRLENISSDTIKNLVEKYGPGTDQEKQQMYLTLMQRKEAILQKANKKAPPPPPPPPPTKHEAGKATLMPGHSTYNQGSNQLVVDPSQPDKKYNQVYSELTSPGAPTRPKPTHAESQYVSSYTGSYYHSVNDCLRYLTDCEHIEGIQEIRSYVSRAKTDRPLTLFRGINGPYMQKMQQMFNNAHASGKPAKFEDGGFLSMSTSESTALAFAHGNKNNMFIIEVPAGSHVASADNSIESEMIGQLGSRLIVTGRDPLTGYWKATLDQSHMQEKAPE